MGGSAVDENDRAFYNWKKCVQCASSNPVPAYDYDADSDSCAASASGAARGVCECDKALVQALYDSKADNSNYNTHFWASFNTNTHCCDKAAGINEIGTC